jgi:glycerol-3-phosphate dehydrogenase
VYDTWKRPSGTWTTTSEYPQLPSLRLTNAQSRYALVVEALRERRYFLDTAPHLSQWLPIMIPLQKWWQIPYFWAGTKFYDFLAGSENIESSYFLTKSKALDAFPMLKKEGLVGSLVYYGMLDVPRT